jgi:hypothetical protein
MSDDILDKLEVEELIQDTKEFMQDPELKEAAVKTAGWTKSSVEKFGNTIGHAPSKKGFFDACVLKMKRRVDDPEGFCASLKDKYYGTTNWRGKDKEK